MDKLDDLFDFQHLTAFNDLHFKYDAATGMKAIVAIHSTKLGSALGGCRFIEYPHTNAAIVDALRLARGMSYKAAISGLPFGGGKAVIIKPSGDFDRTALFKAFGRFVAELGGRYITAKDSGTSLEDMDIIAAETPYVSSTSEMVDPSPYTAHGVRRGIEAAVKCRLGKDTLEGVHVAIQGVGSVGHDLAKELYELGARLTVCDVDAAAVAYCVDKLGAIAVPVNAIYSVECDVFAPCALGAVINTDTIPLIKAKIIAGAANNQLAENQDGEALKEKGILYAPDYAINAGGLLHAATKYQHGSDEAANKKIHDLYDVLMGIFNRAAHYNLPTNIVADHIAEERL